ncbi:UNVERIFIED_CONTAM: hypothetical protein Q9R58_17750 [Methylobacteriaceae bacterium AG10]|nr:hypothetical protein [Methylobacteriaceae bacterium AG10]
MRALNHPFPGRTAATSADAHRIVREALERHGGPSDRALLDVLWSYIHAPEGGREALFLAVAARAVGKPYEPTAPVSERPDPEPSAKTSDHPVDRGELLALAQSLLALVRSLQRQPRS